MKKELSDYTEKEVIEEFCKKYNLHNFELSYFGCDPRCPFHCPEPDDCFADEIIKKSK